MESKFLKNISWILIGNLVHAVFQYIINIICARSFGPNDYGLINYAASWIVFFSSVGSLGINGIITKKFVENEEKVGEYLGTAILARCLFSIFAICVLQIIIKAVNPSEARLQFIVFIQSFQILFESVDLIVYWLRYKNEAKIVAIIRLIAFFAATFWRIVSIVVWHDVIKYLIGVLMETVINSGILVWFYRKKYQRFVFSAHARTFFEMIKISYPFIFSAVLVTVYAQTDKIMLKSMLNNDAVGMYSVSQTLAGAISIIPTALIEGFRPEILKNKNRDNSIYQMRLKQLYGIVFWISVAYGLLISLFSKHLILFLYGEKYLGAKPALSLIVWYTSFSYFGAINNIYMVAENKTVWVQISTLVGAVVNVILNLLLIPTFRIVGAAAASLITQVIVNFALLYFIKPLKNNYTILLSGIMLHGFNKDSIISLFKKITKKEI